MSSSLLPHQLEFYHRLGRITFAQKQTIIPRATTLNHDPHIVYLLGNALGDGDIYTIVGQACCLTQQGFQATLISHHERPEWFPPEVYYEVIPFSKDLAEGIPPCDIIVATYWDQLQACVDRHIAPVVYFEQGGYHLFANSQLSAHLADFIRTQISLPPFILTTCQPISTLISDLYHRTAQVIPSIVNPSVFNLTTPPYPHPRPYLLMRGSDINPTNKTDEILAAYKLIKGQFLDLDLIWVTPTELSKNYLAPTKIFVNPSRQVISSLYRGAFIFLATAPHGAFSLSTLEAMACGCPVITTSAEEITDDAVHRVNCLLTASHQPKELAQNILLLINQHALRTQLIENGIKVAQPYSNPTMVQSFINFYTEVAQYQDAVTSTNEFL